jgi:uncharacterized membrane protein
MKGRSATLSAFWVILALAVSLRVLGLDKSLWSDECGSVSQAQASSFLQGARQDDHPPLYFAVLRSAMAFTRSFPVLRLVSVAFGLAAIAAMMLQFPGLGGVLAALLVACSPEFTYHAQELRPYALLFLLMTLCLGFSQRLLDGTANTREAAWASVALALAVSTHLCTVFFAASLATVAVVRRCRARTLGVPALVLVFLPAAALFLFFDGVFLLHANKQAGMWWIPATHMGAILQMLATATGWSSISWIADACGRHFRGGGLIVTTLAAAAVGIVFVTALAHRAAGRARALAGVAFLYWALAILYSVWVAPIIIPRILLPGAIALYLALGLGVAAQPAARWRRGSTCLLVLIALALSVPWIRGGWRSTEDVRGMVQCVMKEAAVGDHAILMSHSAMAFQVYWPAYEATLRVTRASPQDNQGENFWNVGRNEVGEGREGRVFLVYRRDNYYALRQDAVSDIGRGLEAGGFVGTPLWDKDYYSVEVYTRRRGQ